MSHEKTINTALRHCSDIGMFAIDRPCTTCTHATSYCRKHCFNIKLYRAFGHGMKPKDVKNEEAWSCMDGITLSNVLDRKRKPTDRIRLMTRGEAISTMADIDKVASIATANPDRLVWVPTRAWRNPVLREAIEARLFPLPNLRLQASLDPSNTDAERDDLTASGWSTMFFGDDTATAGRFLCPKTHDHASGHCLTCKGGCFSSKQTHVHLKQH